MKKCVVALGGNALIQYGEKGEVEQELKHLEKTLNSIAPLFKKYRVVLTHGNGPQVGNLLLMQKNSKNIPNMPLYINVARTQGEIGILIHQKLEQLLSKSKILTPVSSILTRVLVDPKDPEFKKPSKPVGPFYSKKVKDLGERFIKTKKGYRKVVPSPKPLKIVELLQIKSLIRQGCLICCGGGGIPVDKNLKGVNAVIDKDLASSRLAVDINADLLIILTDVDFVYTNYMKKNQMKLRTVSLCQIKNLYAKNEFPKGSMGPKIEAAIKFLENKGKKVIICSPKNIKNALIGKSGTVITR